MCYVWQCTVVSHTGNLRRREKKMKNLLNCKSLIRMAVIMLLMAFMASQVTDADAGRRGKRWLAEIINHHGTSGGDHKENCNDNQNGGNGECPTCCDAWDKLLTDDRFELVMNGEGVRDNETCLVWEQRPGDTGKNTPNNDPVIWDAAWGHCYGKKVGDRRGWRLPTLEELATLHDDTQLPPQIPAELSTLTTNIGLGSYWSSTNISGSLPAKALNLVDGSVSSSPRDTVEHFVWCVRGGQANYGQ
jgi:hypothetical protein